MASNKKSVQILWRYEKLAFCSYENVLYCRWTTLTTTVFFEHLSGFDAIGRVPHICKSHVRNDSLSIQCCSITWVGVRKCSTIAHVSKITFKINNSNQSWIELFWWLPGHIQLSEFYKRNRMQSDWFSLECCCTMLVTSQVMFYYRIPV